MANGDGVGFFSAWLLLLLVVTAVGLGGDERQVILESIDSKMHTHAADGSIQGIGGWY